MYNRGTATMIIVCVCKLVIAHSLLDCFPIKTIAHAIATASSLQGGAFCFDL